MFLPLHIRLVAMISLKLCVLPGLFSLFISIQILNCKRQLHYSVYFMVYCRETKTHSGIQVTLGQLFKGKGGKVFLQDHISPYLVGHLCWFTVGFSAATHHPQAEFTELLKWRKGLPKPLQPLLLSSHGSELFNASSYVLEKPKLWVQDYLDLKFDSDLSPFTDICFNL